MTQAILQRRYWLLPLLVWTGLVVLSLDWNLRGLEHEAEQDAAQQAHSDCGQCHDSTGNGAMGGGGLTFAFLPPPDDRADRRNTLIVFHGGIWLLLAGLTSIGLARDRRQLLLLEKSRARQATLVEQRTAELVAEIGVREQAEERLRLFIESSGEGFYGTDREGRCTLINPAALRMLGYSDAAELTGRRMHPLIHHSHRDGSPYPERDCPLAATYREGRIGESDNEVFWRADGSSFAAGYRSYPIYLEGQLTGAVVTFADISRRKQAEAELKLLYQALEHSPASVIVVDTRARIQYVNRKFTEVTGYRSDEVLGHNPRILKSNQTPRETYRELFATITQGREWRGEFLNRRKDGVLFWERASISPVKDDKGRITHYVAVKEDITERKRLQSEMWNRANYDQLTGLPNRAHSRDLLEQGIANARQRGHHVGLLFIDLDGFKSVNDSLGHAAGDELLQQVARRLRQAVREGDSVGRLGGDEFAVILTAIRDVAGMDMIAGKILHALAEPFTLAAGSARISGSVGGAVFPLDGSDGEALLKSADHAMYRAKHGGKNAYRRAGDASS